MISGAFLKGEQGVFAAMKETLKNKVVMLRINVLLNVFARSGEFSQLCMRFKFCHFSL